METARTPVHRAILRPATTNMPAKILPGAHKPRPAAQPTVDEILNKTARGEQIEQTPRHGQRSTRRPTPSTPQFAQPRVDTGRGTRRVHGQIVDATLRGELTNMLDQRDADPEQGGWHPVAEEERQQDCWRSDATPEKRVDSNNLNMSVLSGAPTPPSYSRPGTAGCPSTRPGTASTACSSSGWDRSGFQEEESSSIISGLAKTGDGRKALINMLQSQMRAESESAGTNGSIRPGTGSTINGSPTSGGSGGCMTEREAMEAKRAAYRAELDAQVKEQARLRSGKPASHELQQGFFWTQPNQGCTSSSSPDGGPTPPLATPYAIVDDASPSRKMTAASPEEMAAIRRNVKTMHWGERQVLGWKEKEERQRQYREELARQVEQKRMLTQATQPAQMMTQNHLDRQVRDQELHVREGSPVRYEYHEEENNHPEQQQYRRQMFQAQQEQHQHMRTDVWQASPPQTASASSSYAADLPIHDRFAAAPTPTWRGESAPWDSNGPLSQRCDSSADYHVIEEDRAAYGRSDDTAFTACDNADKVLDLCRGRHADLDKDPDATPTYSPRGDDDATPRSSAGAPDEARYTSEEYRAIAEKMDQLQQEVMRQKTLIADLSTASAPSRKATPAQPRTRAAATPAQSIIRPREDGSGEQGRALSASSAMMAKRRAARSTPLWQPRSR